MNKDAVIIGYSGHAYVVIDILELNNYNIVGYCDAKLKEVNPFNLNYIGNEQDLKVLKQLAETFSFLGIGNNKLRAKVYDRLSKNSVDMPALIHPNAIVSKHIKMAAATVVMAGAIINPLVEIKTGSICNSRCIIEHECTIGKFTHIAPGAVLTGNVSIGDYSFIGANSVIRQGINIGSNVTIGAGSVVVSDVPNGVTVFGNPAKIKI